MTIRVHKDAIRRHLTEALVLGCVLFVLMQIAGLADGGGPETIVDWIAIVAISFSAALLLPVWLAIALVATWVKLQLILCLGAVRRWLRRRRWAEPDAVLEVEDGRR
ncbi:MAG TPA: hypothetical protein VNK48_14315 [Xanthobacteraceae bacterium]|nr:hypothetical protein [Xanthobacteraceae bacterium]